MLDGDCPSKTVPLPRHKDGPEALLLHFAAEVAQPLPIWPPGMMETLRAANFLEQIDYVKVLVATVGCIRMLEDCAPVLEAEPEVATALGELHNAGIITHPLPYNPAYVDAKGWASFYMRHPFERSQVPGCCR